MNKITCNGSVTNLKLAEGALSSFSENDLELLQYAIWAYSYVNSDQSAKYEISIQDWINNILKVYSVYCKRTSKVINTLSKLI